MNHEPNFEAFAAISLAVGDALSGLSAAMSDVGKAYSDLADILEPHRVVRREALEEGIHPAIHEGAL